MKTKRSMESRVRRGLRYTLDKDLALRLGKEEGKIPSTFISPKHRETFVRAWPELGYLPPVEVNG